MFYRRPADKWPRPFVPFVKRSPRQPVLRSDLWTAQDIATLREMAAAGRFKDEIGKALGRTRDAVRTKAAELKIALPHPFTRDLPSVDLDGLAEAHQKGVFVLARAAAAHGLSVAETISGSRYAMVISARQHAIWLMAKVTTLSFSQIGKIVGGRDHTTIIHSVRVMNQRTGQDVRGCGTVRASKILLWQLAKARSRARRLHLQA